MDSLHIGHGALVCPQLLPLNALNFRIASGNERMKPSALGIIRLQGQGVAMELFVNPDILCRLDAAVLRVGRCADVLPGQLQGAVQPAQAVDHIDDCQSAGALVCC
jgi:hypothetical protein